MRYLMYANSYEDDALAAEGFRTIPQKVRARLARMDYSMAEHRCPQGLPIAKLMREAIKKLAT
jgi:hypothetical protein